MSGCGHEHEDGAYVLGALSPDDRAEFERHLSGCRDCSAAVRDLAGLPGLLARVPQSVLEGSEPVTPVPETLLPSLVRRARRTRRRRTWLVAVAAAAVLLAAGAGAASVLGRDDAQRAAPLIEQRPADRRGTAAGPGGRRADLGVGLTHPGPVGHAAGPDLHVRRDHGRLGRRGEPAYAMFVTRRDGTSEQVASWRALPGRTMHLSAATAAVRGEVTAVEVRTTSGMVVLRLG